MIERATQGWFAVIDDQKIVALYARGESYLWPPQTARDRVIAAEGDELTAVSAKRAAYNDLRRLADLRRLDRHADIAIWLLELDGVGYAPVAGQRVFQWAANGENRHATRLYGRDDE